MVPAQWWPLPGVGPPASPPGHSQPSCPHHTEHHSSASGRGRLHHHCTHNNNKRHGQPMIYGLCKILQWKYLLGLGAFYWPPLFYTRNGRDWEWRVFACPQPINTLTPFHPRALDQGRGWERRGVTITWLSDLWDRTLAPPGPHFTSPGVNSRCPTTASKVGHNFLCTQTPSWGEKNKKQKTIKVIGQHFRNQVTNAHSQRTNMSEVINRL